MKGQIIMITCNVPKDLSHIKTKLALGLTKRQLICFGGALITGLPFYFISKSYIGVQASSLLMVAIMLPFFFLGLFERDGFPAERILYFMLRQKFLLPGIRPYRSENAYRKLEKDDAIRKEVELIEEKLSQEEIRNMDEQEEDS